jgi:acyl carrier protein
MRTNRDEILAMLYSCLSELNEQLAADAQLPLAEDTAFFSDTRGLDSLGMVNFVSAIEEKIEAQFGQRIALPSTGPEQAGDDPWRSVGELADFLTDLINQHQ